MNKKLFLILRILISVAILFALFKFVPYPKLWKIYKNSTKIYIFFGFLVFFSCYLLGISRWRYLLSSLGIKISLREAFYSFFAGMFFNLFFPSLVAGDIFRGFSISYRYKETKKVASSVLMDRFSGAVALNFVALLSFIIGRYLFPTREVLLALTLLSLAIGLAALLIFSKTFFSFAIKIFKKESLFRKRLIDFHDQLYFFKQNPSLFMKSLFISLPLQILTPVAFFFLAKAFGLNLGIIYFLILVPIIMAISLIPITIAGAGTREAAAVYFFSLIGVEKSISLGISLLVLAYIVFAGILGGIFYVSIYHRWLQSRPPATNK